MMLDPSNWLMAIASLAFGFGQWLVTAVVILLVIEAFVSPLSSEHPLTTMVMSRRRWLTLYTFIALAVNLATADWVVTQITTVVLAVAYGFAVYVFIPASRRSGKVIPR